MGIPTVVCSVCNLTVNKSQTVAIAAGKRACKSHDVSDQSAKFQDEIKAKHEKSRVREPSQRSSMTEPLKAKCFCCDKEGKKPLEVMELIFKCQQDFEVKHGCAPNPFNNEEMAEVYAPLKDVTRLVYVGYEGKLRKHLVNRHAVMAAELVGFILACPDCCDKHKMKPYQRSAE